MKTTQVKRLFMVAAGMAVLAWGSACRSAAAPGELPAELIGWEKVELRSWVEEDPKDRILDDTLTGIGFPETGNVAVDEANRDFVKGVLGRTWAITADTWNSEGLLGVEERLDLLREHEGSLAGYTRALSEELGGMMNGSVKELRKLKSVPKDEYLDWCVESRRETAEFRERMRLETLQAQGDKAGVLAAAYTRPQSSPSNVVIRDTGADAGKAPEAPSPAEKWKKLNAAMDAYEVEKNAAADRGSQVFKSEYEKQAYENIVRTVNAGNQQRPAQIQEQRLQAAQLQGQILDLKERIAQKNAAIRELNAKLAKLKKRVSQATVTLRQTQAQNRQIEREIAQVKASIAAEEASLRAMQEQQRQAEASARAMQEEQSYSDSSVDTFMGGLSLFGAITGGASFGSSGGGSMASGRSSVSSAASGYAGSSVGGGSGPDWGAYTKSFNARNQAYVSSQSSGSGSVGKIIQYRQR